MLKNIMEYIYKCNIYFKFVNINQSYINYNKSLFNIENKKYYFDKNIIK